MIDAKTSIYGLIGKNISYSLSPKIHNFLFEYYKINAVYLVFDANFNENDFNNFIKKCQKIKTIKGFNITIPYKEYAGKFLDQKKEFNIANCIKFNEKISAFNTDSYGFKKAVREKLNFDFYKKNILIYGAGATAKSIIYAIIDEVNKIFVINRNKKKAEELKKISRKIYTEIDNLNEIELVINATSVDLNIDYSKFKNNCCFFDVKYLNTYFIENAIKNNFKAINGMWMLIYQAVKSFELWTGIKVEEKLIEKIYRGLNEKNKR